MKIHALTTGTAEVKESFLHAVPGPRRQAALFLPGPFAPPLPIHCYLVEHEGRRLLVDTGELAATGDLPFVRFHVRPEDELPVQLREQLGLSMEDVDEVVLTHLHGDHMNGAVHVRGPVRVHDAELRFANGPLGRVLGRALKQGLPAGVRWDPFPLTDGPFGGFARTRRLTPDGRIRAVATPGHTPGHVSVLCEDDDGHHVLLAGDATDTLEQLRARRPDAVGMRPKVTVATIDAILEHGRRHPTVYVPAHDPESVARLAARTTL